MRKASLLFAIFGLSVVALSANAQPAVEKFLPRPRPERMMADYHRTRAEEKVRLLRAKYAPKKFTESQEEIRAALKATFMMPPASASVTATPYRTFTIDGLRVEQQLLCTRPGVYSTALLFLPEGAVPDSDAKRFPAILMLPGHGDQSWSPNVQNRCLSFAKQGYIVMLVQPFGQMERGENVHWNEFHDSQSAGYLLVTGQSLLGFIMADHQAELTYLIGRKEVDEDAIAVTGVSMGGSHSLWLSAIEPRLQAAVCIAALPLYMPALSYRHHGLCDVMFGAYDVADSSMIQALCAPTAVMRIYPGDEKPLSDEGWTEFLNSALSYEGAKQKYGMDATQIEEHNKFEHDVYKRLDSPQNYTDRVVPGPHDYVKLMRQAAQQWFARFLKGVPDAPEVEEPALSPISDLKLAKATLDFWPKGERLKECLSPTAYTQREITALMAKLPSAPQTADDWQQKRNALKTAIRQRLAVPLDSPDARLTRLDSIRIEICTVQRFVVEPEKGIQLPVLLFEPPDGVAPNGRLVVLLHPDGKKAMANAPERKALSQQGCWVVCTDLRGMGESRYDQESGTYAGFHDMDVCMSALKLGNTFAGYWTKDLLAVVDAVRETAGQSLKVTVHGEKETGLIAVLAAGQTDSIQAVEAKELLASYVSPKGYGLPYAYRDETNNAGVSTRKLGGLGTLVPCIPYILKDADIPQMLALVAPRSLTLTDPVFASGDALSSTQLADIFAWTKSVYSILNATDKLTLNAK